MTAKQLDNVVGAAGAILAVALLTFGIPAGSLVGLATQPFWFRLSARSRDWGVFVVSTCFTAIYVAGVLRWMLG